ncbi:acyl-CoA thioesterase [Rheinheimera baltica]|uniref:acyl-CoA thioesterase n=1 Tax=Rheinheimera baltica TaxID=67576 RepID=UPI00040518E0|nr:thioesterase family protein [Rheinheimera baltica]MDP5142936.1 thioesterase family protein [Rheinheimera baltica]MDP5149393.1 thioesterase family protein [Rheinheimera baltica]MDP5191137.1 thioesterase family protein [Rheinheimera baltica]
MHFYQVIQQFNAENSDEHGIDVPPHWGQGRAVFGGMAAALAMAHLLPVIPAGMPLRSVSVSFVAPLNAGAATVRRRILRQGKSVIQAQAEIEQDGQIALVLLASFGAPRQSQHQLVADTAPQWQTEKVHTLPKQGQVPEFTTHFDYRISHGQLPFSASPLRQLGGDIRMAGSESSQAGILELLALVDAWPPVSLTLLNQPAPASSLTWTIEFIAHDLPFTNTDWWRYLAEIEFGAEGYHHISAKLWQPDGKLAAISRQTVTVFA